MKPGIRYTEEPMGELKIVKDFLPRPEELALKDENITITISVNKSSIDFFKKQAKERHTTYQKMIRRLVDWYASEQQKGA
ncbi:MAG: CopG family transcriptional regulator [Deltaproteobacteria bacterium]|nr:CopG family transcriptional regulator [Deltaproteobacteria bacterium]